LANIVNDLLLAARADINRLHVTQVRLNLRDEVSRVLDGFDQVKVADIRITGEAIAAAGDPERVRQVLRNLVSNALRYGGDTIRVEVTSEEAIAKVLVCDNGTAIPEEDRQKIFQPYQRARNTRGLTESLGLGLAISRQLAQLMGGDLACRNNGGESIFEFTLPIAV